MNPENTPLFKHYLHSFGSIGVFTSMTLRVIPRFMVHKSVYQGLAWSDFFNNFDKVMHDSEYLSMFCKWKEEEMSSVWVGRAYPMKGEPPKY